MFSTLAGEVQRMPNARNARRHRLEGSPFFSFVFFSFFVFFSYFFVCVFCFVFLRTADAPTDFEDPSSVDIMVGVDTMVGGGSFSCFEGRCARLALHCFDHLVSVGLSFCFCCSFWRGACCGPAAPAFPPLSLLFLAFVAIL